VLQASPFFQTGSMAFALYPRDELAKDAGVAFAVGGFSGMTLAYNARTREEVDTVLAEAVAAGATSRNLPKKPSGADIPGMWVST
jgi:hypothetical protein